MKRRIRRKRARKRRVRGRRKTGDGETMQVDGAAVGAKQSRADTLDETRQRETTHTHRSSEGHCTALSLDRCWMTAEKELVMSL